MKTGEYYLNFLSVEEKERFLGKQKNQGRNTKHFLEMSFYCFNEFIISAFIITVSDYKYWTEIANRKVE